MQLPKEHDGMLAHIGMWFFILCIITPIAWIIAAIGWILKLLSHCGIEFQFLDELLEEAVDFMLSLISK